MNVVIISYHTYNNNSALHITGFANALTALGHRIVVSAIGPVSDAGDFGVPRFRCISHQLISKNPELLGNYFAGAGTGVPDLIHCWTPREGVRDVARAIIKHSNDEWYEGQPTLAQLAKMLPSFSIIRRYPMDVLFKNRAFNP